MPTKLRCQKCGGRLATLGGQTLCPLCLMQEAVRLGDEQTPQLAPHLGYRTRPPVAPERSGDRIDRYQLLRLIGTGGMGIVYLAEQAGPVSRRVALKVIKPGMDTQAVIARFETERQILALLDHPHIARVLDAGVTEAGRPYFVMELVQGIKITEYCVQNHLPLREQLDLFVKVCKAIQHAHQKGIIHRDLKPSNILVEFQEGGPVPKVIDFGIAKAIRERPSPDSTALTALAQFLGTPAYMSPEQTAANGLDVDTRSDVYSLGVLLYELLTGQTPFDPDELRSAGIEAMCRIIREQEPVRPSIRLAQEFADVSNRSRLQSEVNGVAADRRMRLKELTTQVRGDLDWIVMKALEKDRSRRYDTASSLALDIQRYLGNEPVLARPPSPTYRFQKLVRRNRLVVAAVSAVIVALIAGLTSSTWLYLQERADLHRALAAEQKATTVAEFLKTVLQSLDPELASGQHTPMLQEILDKTARRVTTDLASQPIIQAELCSLLGNTYYQLNNAAAYAQAEAMHRTALRLRKAAFGEPHRLVAASLCDLGNAITMEDRQPEGQILLRQALAMRQTLFGKEHPEVAKSLTSLADNLTDLEQFTEAETLQTAALTIQRKLLKADDPDIFASLYNFARILQARGRLVKAEEICRELLALSPGKASLVLTGILFKMSDVLRDQGKLPQAEIAFRAGIAMRQRVLGTEQPLAIDSLNSLTLLLQRQGKLADMEVVFQEHLQSLQARLQAEDAAMIETLGNLTLVLVRQGKWSAAEASAREGLTLRERKMPDDWRTFNFRSVLGGIFTKQHKYEAAEPLLVSGYQGMKERETKIPAYAESYYKESLQRLVQFYAAMARPEKVADWSQKLAAFGQNNSATNAVNGATPP